MRSHKEDTNSRLDNIDDNLREHMRRTDILETLHHSNETRIEKLEEPRKALSLLVKVAGGVATVAGALFAISRLK